MIRALIAAASLIALTTVASSQEDPIKLRRDTMKGVGAQTKAGGDMAKGERPFDLAKAKEIFETYIKAAETVPNLFPETSKTGGDTTAGPKIWEDMPGFRARFASWEADVKKASADTTDLATFRTGFGTVAKGCGGCHETFRIKK